MMNGAISDYYLERYVLGELPPEGAREVERAAAADSRVRAALDEIASSNRDILALYPPAAFKDGLLARLKDREGLTPDRERRRFFPAPGFSWRRGLAVATASVALALALIVVIPRIKGRIGALTTGEGVESAVVKGEAGLDLTKTQLLVYQKHGDLAEILSDGNQAEVGALLQLAYVANAEPYGVILSVDGRGAVTRHFPAEPGASTLLALNKRALLPNAIELDDAPGFERFFLITSRAPVDVPGVLAKAAELARDPGRARHASLDLPAVLSQSSVLILKGEGWR